MSRHLFYFVLLVALIVPTSPTLAENWPGWRGPRSDGTCVEKDVPMNWDPAQAVWKTRLPGLGHASPIVWGERLYTVTGLKASKERVLLCVDCHTGNILWQQIYKGRRPLDHIDPERSAAPYLSIPEMIL